MTNYRIHLSSFFIVILTYYHSTIALKSALLTPTNKLDNGVSIVELKDTTTVSSNSNTKWSMFPTDNIGYHMKLSLNTSWSFDPINTTTIQIQINSDSQIGNQFRELLISFTQHNNIRFSTLIQIDQTDDHLIYPKCERYPNKQQFANYNIYTLSENNETSDRVQTAMNNTFDSYLLPHIPTPNISYPLTFILHNIPSENMLLFSYLNPTAHIRTCSYVNMLPSIPIDIYFASAYQAEQITILSINITHLINFQAVTSITNDSKNEQVEPTTSTQIQVTPTENDYIEQQFANVQTDDIPSMKQIVITASCISICLCFIIAARCLLRLDTEKNHNKEINGRKRVLTESHSLMDKSNGVAIEPDGTRQYTNSFNSDAASDNIHSDDTSPLLDISIGNIIPEQHSNDADNEQDTTSIVINSYDEIMPSKSLIVTAGDYSDKDVSTLSPKSSFRL